MSKPAAIPLFGDAYLADTTHLTTEEHGAYLLLMMAAWRQEDCSLPVDDRKLARITGLSLRKWGAIKETILEFWKVENGRISQARLSKEHAYVRQKSESNRKSAEARWSGQVHENIESSSMRSHCEGNAPPPPPKVSSDRVAKATPSHRASRSSGSRISPDWKPSALPVTVAALIAQWPPGRVERELEAFSDYWTARSRDACRSDWDKVWHNRIRDIHDRVLRDNQNGRSNQNIRSSNGSGDKRSSLARAIDEGLEFLQ